MSTTRIQKLEGMNGFHILNLWKNSNYFAQSPYFVIIPWGKLPPDQLSKPQGTSVAVNFPSKHISKIQTKVVSVLYHILGYDLVIQQKRNSRKRE